MLLEIVHLRSGATRCGVVEIQGLERVVRVTEPAFVMLGVPDTAALSSVMADVDELSADMVDLVLLRGEIEDAVVGLRAISMGRRI